MSVAEEASSIARQINDPALMFASLHQVGIIQHETGDFAELIKTHERCFAF